MEREDRRHQAEIVRKRKEIEEKQQALKDQIKKLDRDLGALRMACEHLDSRSWREDGEYVWECKDCGHKMWGD
jgi:rubrerythrin